MDQRENKKLIDAFGIIIASVFVLLVVINIAIEFLTVNNDKKPLYVYLICGFGGFIICVVFIIEAYMTGKIRMKGFSVDREQEPVRFFFYLILSIAVAILFLVPAGGYGLINLGLVKK